MYGNKFIRQWLWHSLVKLCTKKYENSSTFVKVTAKKSVAPFFLDTVYIKPFRYNSGTWQTDGKTEFLYYWNLVCMIGPTNQKKWLTLNGDPYWVRILDHFTPHQCRIGDFRRFISISHTVSGQFSQHSAKWLMPTRQQIHNILGAIWQTSRSESGLTWKSWFESRIAFGWG